MKSAFVSAGLLLGITLLIGLETWYIDNSLGDILSDIEQIEQVYGEGDYDRALMGIADLEREWDESEAFLCVIVRHSEINEITVSLKRVRAFCKSREDALFFAEIERMRALVNHIRDGEKLTIANLL